MAGCGNFEGVCPGLGNKLVCAANGANTVSVGTGGAMVDGKWYHNDASMNVNIPSAVGAGNTRIDRIVLRADWAGYDVAITRIAGTDAASPVAPAITQTSGTTYDIMLCRALVTTAGTVTVTDERVWAYPYSANGLAVLGTAGSSAGTVAPIYPAGDGLALRRSGTTLGFGTIGPLGIANDAIDSQHYAADSIDTEHYAPDSVDVAALATMVPGVLGRQGGSATSWAGSGTTNYTSGLNVRVQTGVTQITLSEAYYGSALVTFPVAFSNVPITFVTVAAVSTTPSMVAPDFIVSVSNPSASAVSILTRSANGTVVTGTITVNWLAIGPE